MFSVKLAEPLLFNVEPVFIIKLSWHIIDPLGVFVAPVKISLLYVLLLIVCEVFEKYSKLDVEFVKVPDELTQVPPNLNFPAPLNSTIFSDVLPAEVKSLFTIMVPVDIFILFTLLVLIFGKVRLPHSSVPAPKLISCVTFAVGLENSMPLVAVNLLVLLTVIMLPDEPAAK